MYTSDIQTYLEVNEFPACPYIGETFDLLVYDDLSCPLVWCSKFDWKKNLQTRNNKRPGF